MFRCRILQFLFFLCIVIFLILYNLICRYDFSSIFSLRGPTLVSLDKSNSPGVFSPPTQQTKPDLIYILMWTRVFEAVSPDRRISQCKAAPAARCLLTSAKSNLNLSSAVVFHARDLNLFSDLPPIKYPGQKYVFYNHESPLLTGTPLQGAIRTFFDWTMTYRLDSTIFCPYGYLEWLNTSSSLENTILPDDVDVKLDKNLEKRPKTVAWFVSNCETHNKRERYVYELNKYIPVDIYGDCGTFQCPKKNRRQCLEILSKNYKFYIGFENAACIGYVSEKFLFRMALNLVIIVLRRSDYENIVPSFPYDLYENQIEPFPNRTDIKEHWKILFEKYKRSWWFFIAADDFQSPKDLADYLLFLNNNHEEYLMYFEWRKYWRVLEKGDRYCFCDLCAKLYEARERTKLGHFSIEPSKNNEKLDIHQWWNVGTCERNYALKLVKHGLKHDNGQE